jgi:hypothetical protein
MSAENRQKWSETITAWRQRRTEAGLPEPRVVIRRGGRSPKNDPDKNKRPDYGTSLATGKLSLPPDSPTTGVHFRKWTKRSDCVAWVLRYLQSLAPGERSTKRGYAEWARAQDGAPSYSRFDRHGGFESVRRDALKHIGESPGAVVGSGA